MGQGEQLRQGLENPANKGREDRRRDAWDALDLLGTFSKLDRVRKCRKCRTGQGAVEVRYRESEDRAHFAGLQTCGSVWACPLCAERILAGRADELAKAIETHTAAGGEVVLLTLTMRHRREQGLGALWDALGEAWRAASSGSRSVRELLRTIDWVRRVEVTHGEHGWHVHVHALLFVEAGTDPDPIGEAMFAAWGRRLVSLGMDAPLAGPGMDCKLLDLDGARAEIADYLAKGHYEASKPQDRRAAARELASSGKLARGSNRTPMRVLADMVAYGEVVDYELWREWEAGSKGRKALTWSRGARDRLVGDEEASDDELAQRTDGGGEVVALIDGNAWGAIRARKQLATMVLDYVEGARDPEHAFRRVSDILAAHGFPGAALRPPRPPGGVPE